MDERVLEKLRSQAEQQVADLQTFVRMPSVAAQDRGVRESAGWLAGFMEGLGIDTFVDSEANYPVVMGSVEGSGPGSILVYCHYDVQPADEPDWEHDPFGAEIVQGRMYGRGTVDNKSGVIAVLEAVHAYLACGLRPPVTVKFLFEGEEEISSPSLRAVLLRHWEFLSCDSLLNVGDNVWFDGRPRIVCGVKGACMLRLECRTRREFHARFSPLFAGATWRLNWALSSLVAPDGRILVDGFYDDVVPPTPAERQALADLHWSGEELLELAGYTSFLGGRTGLEALQAYMLEPTCNLQGFQGGYVAPNRKGVVPSSAAAEIRFGLVPEQSPERVYDLVCRHLEARGFGDIQVVLFGQNAWARTPLDSRMVQATARALEAAFGRGVAYQPTYTGSGPEGMFQQLFPNMEHAYTGFGPTEDRLHAPNEYVVVDDYLKGIEAVARIYAEVARA